MASQNDPSAAGSTPCYTLINSSAFTDLPSTQDLRTALQSQNVETKLDALRSLILLTMSGKEGQGNTGTGLMMQVIQHCLPVKDKRVKKLLGFYWEVSPKYDDKGKLRQEMILVVNAIRNDLQHPNEYVRGSTLRFLQKIARDTELLDPLIPSLRDNLQHRHSYVRRNALMALTAIYTSNPPSTAEIIIPDAVELVGTFLAAETDSTCIRNAFLFLALSGSEFGEGWGGRELVLDWLGRQGEDGIKASDEGIQLAVLEFVKYDVNPSKGGHPEAKSKYLRIVFELLGVSSHAVRYAAATTLPILSSNTTAIKSASQTLLTLAKKSSDNNVKLIVLARLDGLRRRYPGVLSPLILDFCNLLSGGVGGGDLEVKKKVMGIVKNMTSGRNVGEVVGFLKKALLSSGEGSGEGEQEGRSLVIQNIHVLTIKHPEVAPSVVSDLLPFLSTSSTTSTSSSSSSNTALDLLSFIREILHRLPSLRSSITPKLVSILPQIKSGKVYRGVLWILGEYVVDKEGVESVVSGLRGVLGEVPILASELKARGGDAETAEEEGEDATEEVKKEKKRPKVLADGTYAADVPTAAAAVEETKVHRPPLRTLILGGDYFTSSVLSSSLTKLALRYISLRDPSAQEKNSIRAEIMLILTSVVRVGQSTIVTNPIDEDTLDRIITCLQAIATAGEAGAGLIDLGEGGAEALSKKVEEVFLKDSEIAYEGMLSAMEKRHVESLVARAKVSGGGGGDSAAVAAGPAALLDGGKDVDEVLHLRFFKKDGEGDSGEEDIDDIDPTKEGKDGGGAGGKAKDVMSDLKRIVQLTGFSDPVYAEACVRMWGFDVVLDVLLVNQTGSTLQNLVLDFATLGDLKLVERPTVYTVAPGGFLSVKASIKVSSTETGVIFGSILWESEKLEECCVVLNDVHVDIMDYIKPGWCGEAQFRSMWTEFEWENRVNVNHSLTDPAAYLNHVMTSTNMACLTPLSSLGKGKGEDTEDCDFLSANLYARSLFGEDALANLSVERKFSEPEEGKPRVCVGVVGHVRIRSKTQGIALSLGDRISGVGRDGAK